MVTIYFEFFVMREKLEVGVFCYENSILHALYVTTVSVKFVTEITTEG